MEKLFTLVMLTSLYTAGMPHVVWAQKFPSRIIERTGNGRTGDHDQASALTVWGRYAECLRDRDFKPCFSLLSRNTLEVWRQQYSVKTSSEYADVKGSEEIRYTDLRVLEVKRKDTIIIITLRARGDGEGGKFVVDMEVFLVKENGKWRIDTVSKGGIEYLP